MKWLKVIYAKEVQIKGISVNVCANLFACRSDQKRKAFDVTSDCASVLLPVWRAPFSNTTGVPVNASASKGKICREYMSWFYWMKIIHAMDDLHPIESPVPAKAQ